jgi:type IV pilus assembly protein PilO
MNISLSKLPWWGQIVAFVVLALAGCGLFYYYYEMPARADMTAREQQLIALRADITKGLTTAKKLPEFRSQVAELEARLASLKAVLPEEKDAADLLNRMQTVASQSNLTIKSFKPGATITKQLHAEWPITLELDGTYHNLAVFFDRVGKFTRIVNTNRIGTRRSPPRASRRRSCCSISRRPRNRVPHPPQRARRAATSDAHADVRPRRTDRAGDCAARVAVAASGVGAQRTAACGAKTVAGEAGSGATGGGTRAADARAPGVAAAAAQRHEASREAADASTAAGGRGVLVFAARASRSVSESARYRLGTDAGHRQAGRRGRRDDDRGNFRARQSAKPRRARRDDHRP